METKPTYINGVLIQVGCNYHLKYQSSKSMRFVLKEVEGDRARLITRTTNKDFWVKISDLIFIKTKYNWEKSNKLANKNIKK